MTQATPTLVPPRRRRRLSRDEQKAQTRARLLEAAGRVFAQRGYHDASVEEVAEEAGFSKGAVYSNFDSKEDLFVTLLEQRCRNGLVELEDALGQERLTPDRLRQLGNTLSAQILQDRQWTLLFIEFWAQAVRDPKLRPRFAGIWLAARTGLAELIARHAEEAGVSLPAAPAQLASAAMALANGTALQLLADPDRALPESLGNALALLFAGPATLHDHPTDVANDSGAAGASPGSSTERKQPEVAQMPFDPICGREVSHRSWPLQYAETTYWFCSRACRDDFSGAPRMLITLGPKTAARPLHLNGLPAQS